MKKWGIALGLVLFTRLIFAQHTPPAEPSSEEIVETYKSSGVKADDSAAEKVAKVSAVFLGRPYQGDVCGEGPAGKFDSDPMSCFTGFDCTTYVEAVLALSKTNEDPNSCSKEFWRVFREIKYCDGNEAHFKNRNHFTEIHWCSNQEKKGYLKDITTEVFAGAQERTKLILLDTWIAERVEAVKKDAKLSEQQKDEKILELQRQSPNFANKEQTAKLKYVPLADLLKPEILEKLKKEKTLVFNLIKDEHTKNSKIPVMVSHQGFIVEKDSKLYLRHASPVGKEKLVRDQPFEEYVRERMTDTTWPTLGFNLMRIQ